jgi:hypothetical protein
MVIEWYSDFTVFLKLGPFILATYGLFVGVSCMTHTWVAVAYLKALEDLKIFQVADAFKAPLVAFSTLMLMIGWRLCSMFIEDKHEIDKGNWLRALLRPGFLEAGGHTFLTCYGTLLGLYFSFTSGEPLSILGLLVPMCTIVDSLNVGYTTVMWLLSLGCVTYGCCWGMEVPAGTWYGTTYTSPGAKILRIRPQLKGKTLFPHTTLRGFLFFKNGVILSILGSFFYVPGLFTVIYPLLNRKDKDIYYSKRGDAGGDMVGFCEDENFYMVAPGPKKAHCVMWSKPDQWFGNLCTVTVVVWLVMKQSFLKLSPMPYFMPALDLPSFYSSLFAAFWIGCLSFGYHYKNLGCWLTPPVDAKKAK